jgi:hypothetical protein
MACGLLLSYVHRTLAINSESSRTSGNDNAAFVATRESTNMYGRTCTDACDSQGSLLKPF